MEVSITWRLVSSYLFILRMLIARESLSCDPMGCAIKAKRSEGALRLGLKVLSSYFIGCL